VAAADRVCLAPELLGAEFADALRNKQLGGEEGIQGFAQAARAAASPEVAIQPSLIKSRHPTSLIASAQPIGW
jgi:hypothetical protein